jgi:uncharacterized protein YndB with AHSA1/START domain
MAKAERKHEPIRQSVRVDCPIEDAFRLFTEGFAEWWPLASYSITGDQADKCAIEPWVGGRVYERTRSGEEREWGSVIRWDPPEHLEFTWLPGGPGDRSQTVDVEFRVEADGTRVTLIHTGWDAAGVPACALRFSEFICRQMLAVV